MASLTQWTWVWVSSRSWWWTGKPGVLQSMGLQEVGHEWMTELNWTELSTELDCFCLKGPFGSSFIQGRQHLFRGLTDSYNPDGNVSGMTQTPMSPAITESVCWAVSSLSLWGGPLSFFWLFFFEQVTFLESPESWGLNLLSYKVTPYGHPSPNWSQSPLLRALRP